MGWIIFALALSRVEGLVGDFEKDRAELKKAAAAVDLRGVRDAADRLAASDRKPAVDALLDGYGVCAGAMKLLWADKLKALQQKEANADFRINTSTTPPTIVEQDVNKYKAWQEAEAFGQKTERSIMAVEACKRAIVDALGSFKSDDSVKELAAELAGNGRPEKRAGVAEALGRTRHASASSALAAAAVKDAEPPVRVAALDALRELKEGAPAAIENLKHEFWQVRSAAAALLKTLKAKEGVEPLIDALGKADGRWRAEINEALVAITGVDKHGDPAAWKAWLAAPDAAPPAAPAAKTTFYGIPVESKSVIFILDRSGSMAEPSEWEIPPDVATGPGPKEIKKEGDRKIDIARWQLKKALAMMPDGAEFNLIFYNHEWTILSEKPLKLAAATRKAAFEFIDRLDPVGPTNIYDPLEKGLSFAAAGAMAEKIARSGVDTLFFLTDGMPNTGQVPRAEDILVKVKELNKARKVKIHAIGVFSAGRGPATQPSEAELGGKFLKQLAAENDGRYTGAQK
ncbi:MAG TPA: HEAT repeat domain-containing protein [Planctomycetota bacterium]